MKQQRNSYKGIKYSEKLRTKIGIFIDETEINKTILAHETIPLIHTLRGYLASTIGSDGG